MENPKCPYCGGEMRYAFNGDMVGTHFLICETCLSRSPVVSFDDDPYAAAMKRGKKRKTYFEDFLQNHPKADMLHIIPLTGRDVPNLCRAIIYGETMNCPVLGCTACWNEEMEGEDE
jgi:hypothetical protein